MAKELDEIRTERLTLRGIDESDAEAIVRWRSDPEIYRYFKAPHKLTMSEHLRWYRTNYVFDPGRFDWMCIERESGGRIGVAGLQRRGNEAEVSYLLPPEAQHKGFAAEIVKALAQYAFCRWNTERVTAVIHRENAPSIALVKRLGFALRSTEGDFEVYGIEAQG